ncbi:Yip1 family protein [Halobium salinum]|uniref:Yip1 family protein n=1 Tax=Halobium salinum TaxID=1364940 RepID=A0ABD5P9V8_9EURY|nr:YIP1 family protein [Halobium salinum]
MVLGLLTNPDEFFERRAANPGYLRPALVVLAVAVVSVVGGIPVIRGTLSAVPESAGAFVTIIQVVSAAAGVVATFLRWVVYAAVFYGVAKVAFDGDGGFGETLALVGWGFVPALFEAVVSAVVNFSVFGGVEFPQDPQQIAAFTRRLQSDPAFLVAGLLGIVFLLWSAFLWTFAVRHAQRLDLRAAAITVAVPTVFGLLLRVWGIVGGL